MTNLVEERLDKMESTLDKIAHMTMTTRNIVAHMRRYQNELEQRLEKCETNSKQ